MYLAEGSSLTTSTLTPHEPAPAVTDYARALRAIGQDLSALFPKTLEINTDGVNYAARGESHANPFQQVKETGFRWLWSKVFGKDCKKERSTASAACVTFTRTYAPEDLARLDQLHSANRSPHGTRPDNYCLAERLRTMGGIVQSRKGRLKQLRKDADHLFVDYWDQEGKLQTAKLTTVILYRNQQPYLSHNETHGPKELWEGYDF